MANLSGFVDFKKSYFDVSSSLMFDFGLIFQQLQLALQPRIAELVSRKLEAERVAYDITKRLRELTIFLLSRGAGGAGLVPQPQQAYQQHHPLYSTPSSAAATIVAKAFQNVSPVPTASSPITIPPNKNPVVQNMASSPNLSPGSPRLRFAAVRASQYQQQQQQQQQIFQGSPAAAFVRSSSSLSTNSIEGTAQQHQQQQIEEDDANNINSNSNLVSLQKISESCLRTEEAILSQKPLDQVLIELLCSSVNIDVGDSFLSEAIDKVRNVYETRIKEMSAIIKKSQSDLADIRAQYSNAMKRHQSEKIIEVLKKKEIIDKLHSKQQETKQGIWAQKKAFILGNARQSLIGSSSPSIPGSSNGSRFQSVVQKARSFAQSASTSQAAGQIEAAPDKAELDEGDSDSIENDGSDDETEQQAAEGIERRRALEKKKNKNKNAEEEEGEDNGEEEDDDDDDDESEEEKPKTNLIFAWRSSADTSPNFGSSLPQISPGSNGVDQQKPSTHGNFLGQSPPPVQQFSQALVVNSFENRYKSR